VTAPDGTPLRVLVIEDAASAAELIRRSLERDGMQVSVVATLSEARAWLAEQVPDVMVLDVELPDGSGLDLLRDPRLGTIAPAVVLSTRQAEHDRVGGLEAGAEDYLPKPFYPRELATRVRRAATRGSQERLARPAVLAFEGLSIDLVAREVRVGGTTVELTSREFALLAHLAAFPRRVFSRADLLREVWDSSPEWQTPKTVTEHVRRVRIKIELDPSDPRWIVTVGRIGYRFDPS
jgi:DNA-binding response OmpR family regulator